MVKIFLQGGQLQAFTKMQTLIYAEGNINGIAALEKLSSVLQKVKQSYHITQQYHF